LSLSHGCCGIFGNYLCDFFFFFFFCGEIVELGLCGFDMVAGVGVIVVIMCGVNAGVGVVVVIVCGVTVWVWLCVV
jgi:hypothetical protein